MRKRSSGWRWRRSGAFCAITVLGSYDAATTRLLKAGPGIAKRLGTLEPSVLRSVWQTVLRRAELDRERLRLYISCFELGRLLGWDGTGLFRPAPQVPAKNLDRVHLIDAPCAIVREHRRVVLPVMIARCDTEGAPDPRLVELINEAREAQATLYANRARSITELAKEKGKGPAYYSRLIRLNYLAPDIVAAIVDGEQPLELTRGVLLRAALPLDWAQQRQMFGFPPLPDHGYSPSATTRNHAPRSVEAAFF